jgi:lactoylglutathione lyase
MSAKHVPTLHDPQVNLYVNDAGLSAEFYRDFLGFKETFGTPKTGPPIHIELRLGGMTLGVATTD